MTIISKLFKKTSSQSEVNNKPLSSAELRYEEQLCKAFPRELRKDVQTVFMSFYRPINYYNRTYELLGPYTEFSLNNELVQIPNRIYYSKVYSKKIKALTETQKTIYYCILTRSYDGYLREKYARLLLETDYPQWAIPFIVKLCDDYVLEIVTALYEILKKKDTTAIKQFCQLNKKAVRSSCDRMLNIWYVYDRYSMPDFYEYVGRKLFRECLGYSRKLRKRKIHIANVELERTKNLSILLNKKQ